MTEYPDVEELARRRRLSLRWESELLTAETDEQNETTVHRLVDDQGPLAMLTVPDALTAAERAPVTEPLAWAPGRYLGHLGLALAPTDAELGYASVAFLVVALDELWPVLAQRNLPPLVDGPLSLAFPTLPSTLAWLDVR